MNVIFFDTETTGTNPENDRIIEIAAYNPETDETFEELINPEMPIPIDSTSIHGITNEMVKHSPIFNNILDNFTNFCGESAVLIAHNGLFFDKLFLENEFKRCFKTITNKWHFFDTLHWARRYRPDLARHSLQFLREEYKIPANNAHRALDDVIILYHVFKEMTGDLPIEALCKLMSRKVLPKTMPFGKHKGKLISEVPKSYATWLDEQGVLSSENNSLLRESFVKESLLTK